MATSGSLALTFENRDKPKLNGSLAEPTSGSNAENPPLESIQAVNWHDLVERIRCVSAPLTGQSAGSPTRHRC
jgi:hypothetical protein